MEAELAISVLGVLLGVAIVAGFIDTLAGGGGLIALPALLMVGVPPLAALGTNKLQGSVGTATASWMMLRSGKVRWSESWPLMGLAFVASGIGSVVVQFVNVSVLDFMIPIVLLGIALYFLLAPQAKGGRKVSAGKKALFRRVAVPCVGGYDGMFGPGTGSFFALAGVSLRGQDIVDATAQAKALNFATNVASLLIFLLAGKLVWAAGAVMILGQLIGAWLGSHCLLRIDQRFLRALVVVMCSAMLIRYASTEGLW